MISYPTSHTRRTIYWLESVSPNLLPIERVWLKLAAGQRYDVIINANNTAGNYWFRADAENACISFNNGVGRSIFTYEGETVEDPEDNPLPGNPDDCNDPEPTPQIPKNVPSSSFASQAQELPVAFGNTTVVSNNQSLILWTVNVSYPVSHCSK